MKSLAKIVLPIVVLAIAGFATVASRPGSKWQSTHVTLECDECFHDS